MRDSLQETVTHRYVVVNPVQPRRILQKRVVLGCGRRLCCKERVGDDDDDDDDGGYEYRLIRTWRFGPRRELIGRLGGALIVGCIFLRGGC